MIKYLLLVAVVGLAIWWLRRSRNAEDRPRPPPAPKTPAKPAADKPAPMLACAHCGVHLPHAEAVLDAAGRPFCGEAHRLAGPR